MLGVGVGDRSAGVVAGPRDAMIRCPTCNTEVQPDWDWCHACGWDPDGLRPAGVAAGPPPPSPPPPGGPQRRAPGIDGGPGGAYAGSGPAPLATPPPRRSGGSSGRSIALVLIGAFGGVVMLVVILVLAVTLLGTSTETSRTSSIETATPTSAPTTLPMPTHLDPALDGPGGPGDTVAGDWVWFIDPRARFRVHFPVEPTVTDATPPGGQVANASWFEGQQDGSIYMLYVSEGAPGYFLGDPAGQAQRLVDGQAPDVTITSQSPGTFGSSPSISFTGTMGNCRIEGVAFTQGDNQAFLLQTITCGSSPSEHQRFIDSFAAG